MCVCMNVSKGAVGGSTDPASPPSSPCPLCAAVQCLGDQHAALVGQNCFEAGQAKNTLVHSKGLLD